MLSFGVGRGRHLAPAFQSCLLVALCVLVGCLGVESAMRKNDGPWQNFNLPGKVPYVEDPDLDYYDEQGSKSFSNYSDPWFEHFADGSYLFGTHVTDVLWIGNDSTWTTGGKQWFRTDKFEFALITGVTETTNGLDSEWNKLHSSGVDGVLGMGCPIRNTTQIEKNGQIVRHLQSYQGSHWSNLDPIYSVFMDDGENFDHGFLALGGYVQAEFAPPVWIPTTKRDADTEDCQSQVEILNIYLSHKEWEDPSTDTQGLNCMPGVKDNFVGCTPLASWKPLFSKINASKPTYALFDTGASCFYFPRGTNTGSTTNFYRSPLEYYKDQTPGGDGRPSEGDILWFEFPNKNTPGKNILVKVPYQEYLKNNRDDMPCINESPEATPDLLLLGDPIFRAAQIIFDRKNQQIGISPWACSITETGCDAKGDPNAEDPLMIQLRAESTNARFYTAQVYAGSASGTPDVETIKPQGPLSLILDTGSSTVAFFGQPGVSVLPKGSSNLTWAIVVGVIALVVVVGGIAYYKLRKPPVADYHLMDVDENDEELATARNITRHQQPRGIPASHLEGIAETAPTHDAPQPRQAIPPLAAPIQSHPADDIFNQFEDVMLTGRGDGGL